MGEERGEAFHLMVHLDPQRLEDLCQYLVFFPVGESPLDGFFELQGGFDGTGFPCHEDVGGYEVCVLYFAIETQDPGKGGVVVGVDDGGGIQGVGSAHAHVEPSVESGREPFFRSVELDMTCCSLSPWCHMLDPEPLNMMQDVP